MMLNNIHSETLVTHGFQAIHTVQHDSTTFRQACKFLNLDAEAADGPLTVLVIGWASVVSVAQSLLWGAMVKKGLK